MDNLNNDEEDKAPQATDLPSQSRFRVVVDDSEGALASALPKTLYFEWSIVTDPMDIDDGGQDLDDSSGDVIADSDSDSVESATEENEVPESMDNEDPEDSSSKSRHQTRIQGSQI